ncbi:ATP-dependent helicase [Patescibacteria group bacterium]|nr:ATP-dependent helicase [Patescibacteria group bacterium]
MKKDILKELNQEQKEAVTFQDGPCLIIAGAGTGKTTVITKRIAWLIEQKLAQPHEILALTFTEKAAQEMEERVDRLLPYGYLDLWVSTFHSFCQKILETHALDIGLPIDFKLLDESQQAFLVQQNFDRFQLDYYRPLGNPTKFISALLKHFSRAKDELISPQDYLDYTENLKLNHDSSMSDQAVNTEVARLGEVAQAFQTYQQILLDNNSLDFGDLLAYTIRLFQKRPQILEKYREQFKYVLIDEFQDTNWAQYELIKTLSHPKNNVIVVSDDDQAIYRFRGSSYNNVLQFKKDYPQAKQIALLKNYRSCQNILDLAYDFIQANNPARLEAQHKGIVKKLEAVKKNKAEIKYFQAKTKEDEIGLVVKKIIELKKKDSDSSWNDFAILVRANSQAEAFCQALQFANIPYQFLAHRGLFFKPIIIDLLSYLKLLDNYRESSAIYRLFLSPIFREKINHEDLSNFVYFANKKSWSFYQAMKKANLIPGLSEGAIKEILRFADLIEKHTALSKEENVSRVIYAFLEESGYLKILAEKENGRQSIFWLNQFFKKVESFEEANFDKTLTNFNKMMELMIDTGDTGSMLADDEAGPEAVKITTVHSAKGLEFKWVFIVNLVERRFPSIGRSDPIELPPALIKEIIPEGDVHLQEERRLFYVALTRAKDGLFLTAAEDYGGKTKKKASRFLSELKLNKKDQLIGLTSGAHYVRREEKKEKPSPSLRLPSKFSFSQLNAFSKCPQQYKFAFVLKLPREGKAAFSFGSTIHNTLQIFVQEWMKKNQAVQKNIFNPSDNSSTQGKGLRWEDLLKIYQKCWIEDWYENEEQRKEYQKKGKVILKSFYEDFKKNPPQVLGVEQGFVFKLGDYWLKGKIDRVDRVEGGLELIDYKTGRPKEKLNAEDKEQLLIYQLAAQSLQNIFPEKVKTLTYYYLENGQKCSFSAQPKELEKIKEKLIERIEKIKQSDFPAQPSRLCKYCDFYNICEDRM